MKTIQTELMPDVYERYLSEGKIRVGRYLKVEPYPRNRGVFGFSGWDKNKVGRRYRVIEQNGKFNAVWYAQFLGEAFFRFATVRTSRHYPSVGGAYRRIIVEVSINGKSNFLYFVAPTGIRAQMNTFLDMMTDEDCHEYVWRIHRGRFGSGKTDLDCYYHSIDLPPIDRTHLSDDLLYIKDYETDTKVSWDRDIETPPLTESVKRFMENDRIQSVIFHLKDKIIPKMSHRPTPEDYLNLLMDLAGLSKDKATKVIKYRDYYRLP